MITQQQNGETATKATDQRELLKQSEWMEKEQKLKAIYEAGDIENAIHQLAQVLRNATRLKKELESNQELIEYWKGITANLLNAETSDERTKRYNRPEKDWPDV
jgi:predicted transcriptional regulator